MNIKLKTENKTQFSSAEIRAAKAERIRVTEAEPFGWIAFSENQSEEFYHLFWHPKKKKLECVCADFVFRGEYERNFECKHISAVLKFIARKYLAKEYVPELQKLN